jgi:tetratricopeptide (TPR) repeat protein
MKKIIVALIVIFFNIDISQSQLLTDVEQGEKTQSNPRILIREGNRHYKAGRADEAERSYWRALNIDDRSNVATFNLGSAQFRQQKFDEAAKEFEKAAASTNDRIEKAAAYHNLGNTLLMQQKIKESIEAYKQALRNNPNDMDTKYNLSYALSLLNDDEDSDNDENQDDDDGNDDENQQDNEQQDQNQNQDQQQQQQQISREDAQRMLDAIAQQERELLEKLQQQERAGQRQKIERNW